MIGKEVFKSNKIKILILFIIAFLLILLCFNYKRIFLFKEGLQYQFSSNEYSISQTNYDKEIYFDIDLNNIKKEINKKIEIEKDCFLQITDISYYADQYEIMFESHGTYNYENGLLYTANKYIFYEDNKFSIENVSMLTSNGMKWYNSSKAHIINKYGDSFSYSISKENISNNHVYLTLSNLNIIRFKKIC